MLDLMSEETRGREKKKKTTSSKSSEPGAKTLTGNPICIIRESNAGLIDGNDEFYH
jgi:hypothetical protein